jgi:hypothetical protein
MHLPDGIRTVLGDTGLCLCQTVRPIADAAFARGASLP